VARLAQDSPWLIQQIDGMVVLFHEYTQEEVVRYDVMDADATGRAQKDIAFSQLGEEEKCFAHFWAGYFYACSVSETLHEG
jgi:hypothetical protein